MEFLTSFSVQSPWNSLRVVVGSSQSEDGVGFCSVGVSPDKHYLVAGGSDGKVYYKDMSKEDKDGDVKTVEVEEGNAIRGILFQEKNGSMVGVNIVYASKGL